MRNDDLITIYTAANAAQARQLVTQLEQRGIRSVVFNERLQYGAAEVVGMAVEPKVAVKRNDEAQARVIAQAFDRALVVMAHRSRERVLDPESEVSPLVEENDSADIVADTSSPPAPDWPLCPDCQRPRQTACEVCGTFGGPFPRGDAAYSGVIPPKADASFQVICPTCDEPFVPEWVKTCGACGHDFGDGFELPAVADQKGGPWEELNPRVLLIAGFLLAMFCGLAVYFAIVAKNME